MKFKIIFIAVIILASALRLWSLDNFPAGFNADEAAIGYNAYSLLQTGKDEYGSSWPLSFKSFGDYKPGLYFYLSLPFVAVFGLNEWVVRLPSALLGIGTVLLVFFLAKEIFKNSKVGLIASFLLAISPWHLHFSRGGWETNAATFFITLGIYLYIKGLEKYHLLFWSMVAFLISMYIYQTPRLVIPALVIVLTILYRKEFAKVLSVKKVKRFTVLIFTLLILSMPLIFQFISGEGSARFSGLSFLSDSGPTSRVNELRGEHSNLNSIWAKILHNKLTAYGPEFFGHYLDHFNPDFLFINGDPIIRNKVPETGQFYLLESVFLVIGIMFLAKNKFQHTKLLLAWILIAPFASSMTYQTPHALRALNMVIPLTLVTGYGLWCLIKLVKGYWKASIIAVLIIILSFEFIHYIESYYVHYPKRYPLAWEYGFKEMIEKLNTYENQYEKVVITDKYDQPYILLLFYKKYDPSIYQPQAILSPRDKFNFGTVRNFDNYQFRTINSEEIGNSPGVLFIGTPLEIPKGIRVLDMVKFPNGEPAFIFVEG